MDVDPSTAGDALTLLQPGSWRRQSQLQEKVQVPRGNWNLLQQPQGLSLTSCLGHLVTGGVDTDVTAGWFCAGFGCFMHY